MLRAFPVAKEGAPHYSNDFGVPGVAGQHLGTDIFAAAGTPIIAVDDGFLRFAEDPIGGHAFYLTADDRTVYYGAHLAGYEGTSPRRTVAGEVIGYVGQTGNAAHTSPHLHFEMRPSGGVAVNPFFALSALAPLSVTASSVPVPPAPAPPPDALPPLDAPRPVPPVPRPGSSTRAYLAIGGLAAGAALLAARARKGHGR